MFSEFQKERPQKEDGAGIPANFNTDQTVVIESEKLFEDKKTVFISHNGSWYKLMITKQNKLILTK